MCEIFERRKTIKQKFKNAEMSRTGKPIVITSSKVVGNKLAK
jgi:hypothetical protein